MSDIPSSADEPSQRPRPQRHLFFLSTQRFRDEGGIARGLTLPGLGVALLLAVALFVGTAAWPSANAASVTPVLNPNGASTPTCSDAAAVADPDWDPSFGSSTLPAAVNPGQIDVGSGIISWSHNNTSLSWSSTTPIVLAVIIQGSGNGNAYFYNPPSSTGDTALIAPSSATITQVTFCYLSSTPPGPPTLVIEKQCFGGSGPTFSFNVDPDGSIADPTLACAGQSAAITLSAGTSYTVTEGADPADNWDLTDRTCTGDAFTTPGARDVAFTPELGDTIVCTFTNTFTPPPTPPTLVIEKDCSGGTGPSFSFDVSPNGNIADPTLVCNSNSPTITLVAGTPYTVTEGADPSANWALTNRTCTGDDFTLDGLRGVAFTPEAGDTVVCTFTNTFTPPPPTTLVVHKTCVGGTGQSFFFNVSPNGSIPDPTVACNADSATITLAAGTPYTVTEGADPADGWDLTDRACTGDDFTLDGLRGVAFTPESGDAVVCTFTNTFTPPPAPTLVIQKVCSGDTGPTFSFNVSPDGDISDPTLGCNSSSSTITLDAGTLYTVTEGADPADGWELTGRICTGDTFSLDLSGRGVVFNPEAGDTVACTFTNTFTPPPPAPTLVIEKACSGGTGQTFSFNVDPDGSIADPTLACNASSSAITLVADAVYTVTEGADPADGWDLTGRSCVGDLYLFDLSGRGVILQPEAGDTIVCTFTNTFTPPPPAPTLVIQKVCSGGTGQTFSFNVNPDGNIADPTLACNASSSTITLDAGSLYTVTEGADPADGWDLTGRSCVGDLYLFDLSGRGVVFTPEAGDTIVCTFTNTFTPPPPAPTLVIQKTCSGSTGPTFAFDVSPNGSIADPTLGCNASSSSITLVAGIAYTVTEGADPADNWDLTGRTCTGDEFSLSGSRGVAFTPEAGDTVACTFTNTFTPPQPAAPTLVIHKNCSGGSGPLFSFDVSPNGSIADPTLVCNGTSSTITLVAGVTYVVSEGSSLPDGWTLTGRSCSGDSFSLSGSRGVTFNPEAGDTIVCTFTNTFSEPCGGQRPPRWRGGSCW